MSEIGPISARSRFRCRMISWLAANGISGSSAQPIATLAPSGTKRAIASDIDMSLAGIRFVTLFVVFLRRFHDTTKDIAYDSRFFFVHVRRKIAGDRLG